MNRYSIRLQVLFFMLAIIAVSAVVTGASVLSQRMQRDLFNEVDTTSRASSALLEIETNLKQAEANLLQFAIDPGHDWSHFVEYFDAAEGAIDNALAVFNGNAGGSFPRDQVGVLEEMQADLASFVTYFEDAESEGQFGQVDTILNILHPGLQDVSARDMAMHANLTSRLAELRAEGEANAARSDLVSFLSLGIVVLGGLFLGHILGRKLTSPILAMEQAVNRLGEGDYATQIGGTDRGDEFGSICHSLDLLRDKLSEANEMQQIVAHESEERAVLFSDLRTSMDALSKGDTKRRMDRTQFEDMGEDYVGLCDDFNRLAGDLEELVRSIRSSADTVALNADDLSSMSDDLSRRAETQASTLEQTAAAIKQLSESVDSAAERADEADDKVGEGRHRAEQGREVMDRALAAMSSIARSSERINQIIGVIDDIAFQTNLLALNAGVEAARAGESGKGFSVVASEVRSLAQRASESAREIKDLVTKSSKEVEDGEHLVQETSATLGQIVDSVNHVSSLVSDIAGSAKGQAAGVREINMGMTELDSVTQKNAAMVGDTSAASSGLSREASRLAAYLQRFAGGGDVSEPADLPQQSPEAAPLDAGWQAEERPVRPEPSLRVSESAASVQVANGSRDDIWQEF